MRRQPDLTLHELQQRLDRELRLHLSVGWIWILLRRWGLRHKKNPSARRSRTRARTSGAAKRGGADSGAGSGLSGVFGRKRRHHGNDPPLRLGTAPERVSEAVPAGHWRTLTVLAALTLDGMLASMTIESPTDGDVFLAFLEQALGPKLQPGHIVVLDNLGAHKVEGVRGLMKAVARNCSICRPTRPISIPSSKPGPS